VELADTADPNPKTASRAQKMIYSRHLVHETDRQKYIGKVDPTLPDILISEGSLHSAAMVFAPLTEDYHKGFERKLETFASSVAGQTVRPDLVVFLDSSPKAVWQAIQKGERKDKEGYNPQYLTSVDKRYSLYKMYLRRHHQLRIMELDAFTEGPAPVEELCERIMNMIDDVQDRQHRGYTYFDSAIHDLTDLLPCPWGMPTL
jgi:thymidylate kinase